MASLLPGCGHKCGIKLVFWPKCFYTRKITGATRQDDFFFFLISHPLLSRKQKKKKKERKNVNRVIVMCTLGLTHGVCLFVPLQCESRGKGHSRAEYNQAWCPHCFAPVAACAFPCSSPRKHFCTFVACALELKKVAPWHLRRRTRTDCRISNGWFLRPRRARCVRCTLAPLTPFWTR